LLDHDGYLPRFAVITDGKTHELNVARKLRWEPGTIVVFDRGYIDYEWFVELTRQGVYWVTRLKDNADYLIYFAGSNELLIESHHLPCSPQQELST
jgi:hypothetical protein